MIKLLITKFKVKTVYKDGQKKFIPIQKKTFLGFGWWTDCPEWSGLEEGFKAERALGLDTDSTLTHIREFIDEAGPSLNNEYYND